VVADDYLFVTEQSGNQTNIGKCPAGLLAADRRCLLASLAAATAFGIQQASLQAYLTSMQGHAPFSRTLRSNAPREGEAGEAPAEPIGEST